MERQRVITITLPVAIIQLLSYHQVLRVSKGRWVQFFQPQLIDYLYFLKHLKMPLLPLFRVICFMAFILIPMMGVVLVCL